MKDDFIGEHLFFEHYDAITRKCHNHVLRSFSLGGDDGQSST